ncbi:MAG: tetratricopeptide repeat protein [Rubrivivax sp.]|nr:tetratricopeptide repeat protein [Rubrivivax sp.]
MATQLDLQEQEQLDALKAFWNKQGNLITWTLVVALSGVLGWNGWQWWQRDQAAKASAMFDELDRAAQAGDAEKSGRVFNDLKERFPGTAFAQQGGLLAAKAQLAKGQIDAAKASLGWVVDHGKEDEVRMVARLRLAAVLGDAKQYAEGLKVLEGVKGEGFDALAADRRGDLLMAEGKKDEARAAWQAAYKAMGEKLDYRRLVDAKLTAIGAAPAASAASAPAVGAAK